MSVLESGGPLDAWRSRRDDARQNGRPLEAKKWDEAILKMTEATRTIDMEDRIQLMECARELARQAMGLNAMLTDPNRNCERGL